MICRLQLPKKNKRKKRKKINKQKTNKAKTNKQMCGHRSGTINNVNDIVYQQFNHTYYTILSNASAHNKKKCIQ
jgi:hypothetical protein